MDKTPLSRPGEQQRNLRATRRRPPKDTAPKSNTKDQIARINTLTQTAKTSWFGLLSYLAFVSVTLMGVQDADFFIPSRQTELPVVGVAIPTFLFFALGPLLGLLLYAYFHLHLLKLWEALAEPDPSIDGVPLSDRIAPWLISDFALRHRIDGATRTDRPLPHLAYFAALALAFVAGPAVLAWFWLRSFPAHAEGVTILACGLPLAFALYIGFRSWGRMLTLMTRGPDLIRLGFPSASKGLWLAVIATSLFGWLKTEGDLRQYAIDWFGLDEREADQAWWTGTTLPGQLAETDLQNTVLAPLGSDWKDCETAREDFRAAFAARNGIASGDTWDRETQDRFDAAWDKSRRLQITLMGEQSFVGSDFRYADFTGAIAFGLKLPSLPWKGAKVPKALFDGSNYFDNVTCQLKIKGNDFRGMTLVGDWSGTRFSDMDLRDTDFSGALLKDVNFSFVRLEGTSFRGATLIGVGLRHVSLRDADFTDAEIRDSDLTGSDFIGALMSGVLISDSKLSRADFDGADLTGAKLSGLSAERATFNATDLSDASIWNSDFSDGEFTHANLVGSEISDSTFDRADFDVASIDLANILDSSFTGAIVGGFAVVLPTTFIASDLTGALVFDMAIAGDTGSHFSIGELDSAFGDASVTWSTGDEEPEILARDPDYAGWVPFVMEVDQLIEEWRKWQADPASYTPPEKPQ